MCVSVRVRTRKESYIGFRKFRGIPLPEEEQGIIFYTCLKYKKLPDAKKAKIDRLCEKCGGEYSRALFELVTTRAGEVAISQRFYISESVLREKRKRFYLEWSK